MLEGLNRLTLVGSIGNDPEVIYRRDGTATLLLRVAVTERIKCADGWAHHTETFSCTVIGPSAKAHAARLYKGAAVYVEGTLRCGTYELDGAQRASVAVIAHSVHLLSQQRPDARKLPEPKNADAFGDDFLF